MSGPNRFGSNLVKAQIVMPIDEDGNPISADYPSSVALIVGGLPVSASNPLPVDTELAVGATYTDGSGAFTLGGTSQVVFAANTTRRYLFICNTSDTVMTVNFGTAAVAGQPSITLAANGGYFEPLVPSGQSVNLLCATTGKTFVAKQA